MESPASRMTTEHLGPDATDADLAEFRTWVRQLMQLRSLDEQTATDLLWGDGDYEANAFRFGLESHA